MNPFLCIRLFWYVFEAFVDPISGIIDKIRGIEKDVLTSKKTPQIPLQALRRKAFKELYLFDLAHFITHLFLSLS